MKLLLSIAMMFLFVLCSGTAHAGMLSYEDKQGRMWYVNDIRSVPQQYRDQIHEDNIVPVVGTQPKVVAPSPEPELVVSEAPEAKQETVEIFVTSWCKDCGELEDFLITNVIPFKKYDIEKDKNARDMFRKIGHKGVPVVRIGSEVIKGFIPGKILYLLGR